MRKISLTTTALCFCTIILAENLKKSDDCNASQLVISDVIYNDETKNLTDIYCVGGVVGYNSGNISNCYNIGTITSKEETSGIAGYNNGTITNCYYLQESASGGISGNDIVGQAEAKNTMQFNIGEVCWLLNNKQIENIWGQLLGIDPYPLFEGPKVVKMGNGYINDYSTTINVTTAEPYFTVISKENSLQIIGTTKEAAIYDIKGQLFYRGLKRTIDIPNKGIYIVQICTNVQKVIIE